MSKFTDGRDAFESFVLRGWHGFWGSSVVKQATPEVEASLLAIGKGAVSAALAGQQNSDNHGQSILELSEAGAKAAAEDQKGILIQAGIELAPTALSALAGMATAHVQAGPPPPSV